MVIPTNRPCRRVDYNDCVYKTKREKFNAILRDVEERYKKGQPVLLGTISVEDSELLSRMLKMRNIPHNVLNAKNHARESPTWRGAEPTSSWRREWRSSEDCT